MYRPVPLDDEGKALESKIAAEADRTPAALAYANEAAEAHSILLRIRHAKRQLIERSLSSDDSESSEAQCLSGFTKILTELSAMDRYEGRAIARRDRAIKNLLKAVQKI